jgi:hypothetical protein
MNMFRRTALVLMACLGLAALAAQAKPNFTGDWKLSAAKSDFGQFPAPSSLTQKVVHEEPSLKVSAKVTTDNGDMNFDGIYKTDGAETTNQFGPNEMKSKAVWEGESLMVTSKGQFGDAEVTIKDQWDLSADGKTLTMSRHWSSSMGEMDQKMVLEKQ